MHLEEDLAQPKKKCDQERLEISKLCIKKIQLYNEASILCIYIMKKAIGQSKLGSLAWVMSRLQYSTGNQCEYEI